MRYVFLLWLFIIVYSGECVYFPTYTVGQIQRFSNRIAFLRIGTPPILHKMMISMKNKGLNTTIPLYLESSTFKPVLGGIDIMRLNRKGIHVNVNFIEQTDVINSGCSDCDSIFGIGARSRLWLMFKFAFFTIDTIFLAEEPMIWREISVGKGLAKCEPFQDYLCITNGTISVGNISKKVKLVFTDDHTITRVPQDVWLEWIGDRNVQGDKIKVFPHIDITIDVIPGTGEKNHFRMTPENLISTGINNHRDLLLAQGDNDVVTFSILSFREFIMFRNFDNNTAIIVSHHVAHNYSGFVLLLLFIYGIVFVFWTSNVFTEWDQNAGKIWVILTNFVMIMLSFVVYFYPTIMDAMEGFFSFYLAVGFVILHSIVWIIFVTFVSFGIANNNFGSENREEFSNYKSRNGKTVEYRDSDIYNLFSIMNVSRPTKERSNSYKLMIVNNLHMITILLFTFLLLVLETRTSCLSSLITVMVGFIILIIYCYYLFMGFYLFLIFDKKPKDDLAWTSFWFSTFIIAIWWSFWLTLYILIPFLKSSLTRFNYLIYPSVILYYFIIIGLSYTISNRRLEAFVYSPYKEYLDEYHKQSKEKGD